MPSNRNALIRYKTIDNCLRNRFRRWTLEDLIAACSDALYEYEGIEKGVSKRTVQSDIQLMRSDKLGYNAPIIVLEKKYYSYSESDFSITNIPLTEQDLNRLNEVLEILKQFKGFSHFQDVNGMLQKLEDKIHTAKHQEQAIIDFEKNENLEGLHYLDAIYQAILKKRVLQLGYQSFKAREVRRFLFYPHFLKEYRNRWFVVGHLHDETKLQNLALDRIKTLETTNKQFELKKRINSQDYYKDVIGVTVQENSRTQNVHLQINRKHAPYVLTKPLHHSQELMTKEKDGSIVVRIRVKTNKELERLILGYGKNMLVLQPRRLRRRIEMQLKEAMKGYKQLFKEE